MRRITIMTCLILTLALPAVAQTSGWIGATIADGQTEGAIIRSIEADSPAARAGLQENDVITEYNRIPVLGATQFTRLVRETPTGRTVPMKVRRGSDTRDVQITTDSRPAGVRSIPLRMGDLSTDRLFGELRDLGERVRSMTPDIRIVTSVTAWGLRVDDMTTQLREFFGSGNNGVLVTSVDADSPAGRAGLKAGDVITSANGMDIRRASELTRDLRTRSERVTLRIVRDKQTQEMTLERTTEPR